MTDYSSLIANPSGCYKIHSPNGCLISVNFNIDDSQVFKANNSTKSWYYNCYVHTQLLSFLLKHSLQQVCD